jgi:hypothetical protein
MPGNDLVETVIVVQFGYAQQRRMNAVEIVLLVEELKPLHVPSDMACVRHDLEVGHGSDKPLLLFLEIFCVAERQAGARLLKDIQSVFRGRLALWMEMTRQGSRRSLSLRGTVVEHQTAANCECCTHGRK